MTQIIPLSEGTFTVGRDKLFHTINIEKEDLYTRPIGSLLVEVQPFLIINEKDVILLDTGLGFGHPDGQSHLISNLARHNIRPADITKVLLTHLHKDHAGGLEPHLFFNATIYIYKPEMDFAEKTGMPSYFVNDLQQLHQAENVEWLEGLAGSIDGYIHYEHTGAHAPQHIVYWIESEKGKIFFGGDEAPQFKQMIIKYIAKYDYDGQKAMKLREEWAAIGGRERWLFLFYHDVKKPIATLDL